MSYESLRRGLREARRRRGFSQAELAARSGASRITVARLEGATGADVRTRTLARLCEALDLELTALPVGAGPAADRLIARQREESRRLGRRLGHARLAVRLLALDPAGARRMVSRARVIVDLWQRERLCSPHYVSRWRQLLRGSMRRVAENLIEPGEWADALYQNTPWSFALPRDPA